MTTTGTDDRRHNFTIIDNEIVTDYDLTPHEGWLYVVIASYINQKTGVAFPSLTTLATQSKMSKPTVVKHLKTLQNKGLIVVETQSDKETGANKSNHYKLVQVVKQFNKGGKIDLQAPVKQFNSNHTKPNKKDQNTAPARTETQPDPVGADPANAEQRGVDADHLRWWLERGYKVGMIAYWWYPDGNKYVQGKIVKLTPHFAYFESVNKANETVTQRVGFKRCSLDGKTDSWALVSELDPLQREIAVGSYGMTDDQAVSEHRMKEINMHRADLREQFKNGHAVDADELRAAYGWHKAQGLHPPKERGKLADMVNTYRAANKPAAGPGAPVDRKAPHEEADPNCALCKGQGVVKVNRKIVPCDCRQKRVKKVSA